MSRRMDREGLVTTQVSGSLTVAAVLDSVLELGELTAYSNELWEILLLEDSIRVVDDHRATLESAHRAKELIQFRSRGAIAIVVPDADTRKWAARVADMLRGDTVPVTVFDDEAPARKWLAIHMEHSQFEATTIRSRSTRDNAVN